MINAQDFIKALNLQVLSPTSQKESDAVRTAGISESSK